MMGGEAGSDSAEMAGDSGATNLVGAGRGEPPSGGRRHHRAAIRLSRVDRERLERGEISQASEALHLNDAAGTRAARRAVEARDANERRLLEDRPPHFGAL
ncbi:hypothetical protein I6E29_06730 [Arcanobacterium haemolyticum]|nr:hypothetical protein [Arcanobacterium haemolyticum]